MESNLFAPGSSENVSGRWGSRTRKRDLTVPVSREIAFGTDYITTRPMPMQKELYRAKGRL